VGVVEEGDPRSIARRLAHSPVMAETARIADVPAADRQAGADRCARFGTFPECPLCGGALHPEHAHFKCGGCGWRDSCCD